MLIVHLISTDDTRLVISCSMTGMVQEDNVLINRGHDENNASWSSKMMLLSTPIKGSYVLGAEI